MLNTTDPPDTLLLLVIVLGAAVDNCSRKFLQKTLQGTISTI